MTGRLNQHPLAELIREIAAEELSGSLRLERERVKVVLYFQGGALRYAGSNLRLHRLAESLVRWRVLSEAQLAAIQRAGKSDTEIGAALVEQGVLTEDAVGEMRARQVEDVLRPALLWTDGAWQFDARVRLLEDVWASVSLPELMWEAARRLPQDFVAQRFPNTNERVSPGAAGATGLDLLPQEAFVLSRIDAPLRVHELLSISGLTEAETLHACYALALGGMVERENWPRAFTPEEVAKAQAVARTVAQNSPDATTARAPETKKAAEVSSAAPETDLREELEELFERVGRATNYYQIMGVMRGADQDTIKNSYHRLARRFHPDLFHQDVELHARVEDAFAKIAQAYDTLRDRQRRATYDLKLEKQREADQAAATASRQSWSQGQNVAGTTTSSSPAERAAESFARGLKALKHGDRALALQSFAEAARLEPRRAEYRAHFGQALGAGPDTQHRAEAEIQEAIILEPGNIAFRVMLAELYRRLGFIRRAESELERALSLDPRHARARQLLAELHSKPSAR